MFRMINRTTVAFMGVFLIACLAALAYHIFFLWPRQDCDQRGAWWDSQDRKCLAPVAIWQFTGRAVTPAGKAHEVPPPGVSVTAPAATSAEAPKTPAKP